MIATSGQYIFTVSEVNQFIKDLLDNVPPLQEVLLRGEISNYKLYPSGHHYFTLKDSQCSLKCVMFRGSAARLRFRPENGMQVIASGRISVYPRDGAYQLYCTGLTPEGAGDLSVAFEQLKEKLRKEGLFDETHKKPLPPYPRRIAIVTSPAGAAGPPTPPHRPPPPQPRQGIPHQCGGQRDKTQLSQGRHGCFPLCL